MNDFLTNYFKNPKDKEDFWIALVVIALFLGGIVYSIFPFGDSKMPISFFEETKENVSTTTIAAEKSVSTEFSTLVAQKEDKAITADVMADEQLTKKLNNWIDTTETDIVPEETLVENEVEEPVQEAEIVEAETGNEDTTTVTQDTITAETTESAIVTEDTPDATTGTTADNTTTSEETTTVTTDDTDDTDDTSSPTTSEETVEKSSTTTNPTTKPKRVETKPTTPKVKKPAAVAPKTVIIVGAFAKRHNADKVIRQLEKAKYNVHTFYRKGRLAVSVTHGNNDEKGLQSKLKALKKTYKDAWILRR